MKLKKITMLLATSAVSLFFAPSSLTTTYASSQDARGGVYLASRVEAIRETGGVREVNDFLSTLTSYERMILSRHKLSSGAGLNLGETNWQNARSAEYLTSRLEYLLENGGTAATNAFLRTLTQFEVRLLSEHRRRIHDYDAKNTNIEITDLSLIEGGFLNIPAGTDLNLEDYNNKIPFRVLLTSFDGADTFDYNGYFDLYESLYVTAYIGDELFSGVVYIESGYFSQRESLAQIIFSGYLYLN